MRKKVIKERLIECLLKRMEKRIRRRKKDGKIVPLFQKRGDPCGGRFLTPQPSASPLKRGAQIIIKYKILRLSEPPPLSKGGQKEMQSYVGTRFFVSFFVE